MVERVLLLARWSLTLLALPIKNFYSDAKISGYVMPKREGQ